LTTKIIHKRCSRPLCSSQATTGHQHPHPSAYPPPRHPSGTRAVSGSSERYQPAATRTHPTPSGANRVRSDPERTTFRLFPQDPTACPADPQPQQPPFPPDPKVGVLGATSSKAGHSRCSTLEHRPPLVRQGQRAWTPQPPHDRTT
jgi:hypothetical protein